MKSSIEKTGCDKFYALLTYFKRETTMVLGKVQFFEIIFCVLHQLANSFNIKYVPPAFAGHLIVFFYQDMKKKLVHLVFFSI